MTIKSAGKIISNLHIIKAFLYECREPVSLDIIVEHVAQKMEGSLDLNFVRDRYILPVLENQDYYRQIKPNKWQIIPENMPEYLHMVSVFEQDQIFMASSEAKAKLAQKLDQKSSHVVFDFKRDKRFVMVKGKWGLKDWIIINDKATELLQDHPQGLTEKDILRLVKDKNQKEYANKTIVFYPEKDPRFIKERKVWILVKTKEKEKEREQLLSSKVNIPIHTERKVSDDLEATFSTTVTKQSGATTKQGQKTSQSRLIKQQAALIVQAHQRRKEALDVTKTKLIEPEITEVVEETVAVEVVEPEVIQDLTGNSYFFIEKSNRDRNISNKIREEINKLLQELAPGSINLTNSELGKGKITVRKIEQIILEHYENVKESRLLVPDKYNRYLIELIKPNLSNLVVVPCVHTGRLMLNLLEYLWDSLDNAQWSFGDQDFIEVKLADNTEYSIDAEESDLIEIARDLNLVNQMDMLNHYLDYNFIGIETDQILTKVSRMISSIMGFENAVVFNKDYFSQLPQVLGHKPNDTNSIEERFDVILGNFLFASENTTANYIDQSMQILHEKGQLGCFVHLDFLQLLPGHPFLRSILAKTRITHVIKLPKENDITGNIDNIVLMIMSGLEYSQAQNNQTEVLCAWAEPKTEEELLSVLNSLKTNSPNENIIYVEQNKIERKIIDSTKESVDG